MNFVRSHDSAVREPPIQQHRGSHAVLCKARRARGKGNAAEDVGPHRIAAYETHLGKLLWGAIIANVIHTAALPQVHAAA